MTKGRLMLDLRIHAITDVAEGIKTFDLRRVDGQALPAFTAGAHIDVALPNGLVRQYSLINESSGHSYVIGVNKSDPSRGGSDFMHKAVRVGDTLQASSPRNNFPLDETARNSVLIAGGIGITPILSMVRRLAALGRPWHLFHCTRTRARTPFIEEVVALAVQSRGRVEYIHDGEAGSQPLDVAAAVRAASPDTYFYCCGPAPLMETFTAATRSVAEHRVHVEYFTNTIARGAERGFKVICSRSNRTITVESNESILEALERAGMAPLCSCREGVCGTCETRIVSGDPEHNDRILTPAERASNRTMMICVSRARGNSLTLDI